LRARDTPRRFTRAPRSWVAGEGAMSRLRHTGVEFRRVASAREFGRVAVLVGGDSAEREVSLMTGKAVLEALLARGVDAAAFDPAERPLGELVAEGFDRAWIALHGPGGEDGALQGALEWLGLPYTGSGVLGSAVGMDKLRTKRLAQAAGVATPPWITLTGVADFERAVAELGLPLAVKPASQGSSVGMSRVAAASELPAAWRAAAALDPVVIAERWITGGEFTVAILQGEALPAIRIETPRTFYDYQAKYFADDTRYLIPCGLPAASESAMQDAALATFAATGAAGWGRVDFVMGADSRALLLEINTVPGMTGHSLVPMAAAAAGIDFAELVWRILETSFARERT
jgi:D-alanine-D-alanine ligase